MRDVIVLYTNQASGLDTVHIAGVAVLSPRKDEANFPGLASFEEVKVAIKAAVKEQFKGWNIEFDKQTMSVTFDMGNPSFPSRIALSYRLVTGTDMSEPA